MGDNKKVKKVSKLVLLAAVIVGIVLATVSTNLILSNLVNTGTVEVEQIDLQLKDLSGNTSKEIADWEPGDVDIITWKVKNIGTAGVYTRNKLQIYWNEEAVSDAKVLYLYPANMTRKEIIEDFNKGDESEYAIDVTRGELIIDDETKKEGIEYTFLGDVLDGTKMVGVSKEVDYNLKTSLKITDDNNSTEDDIAFNILFSPKTSYLYEGKTLTIKVVTEAMQFTEEGKEEWQIVDTQTLGD